MNLVEASLPAARSEPAPATGCVHHEFERQAALAGSAVAVEWPGGAYSYAELDRRATLLAFELRRRGVQRGSRVALGLDRSPELVVAMLAVLKAGAAYVPLDERDPPTRRALKRSKTGARWLIGPEGIEGLSAEPTPAHALPRSEVEDAAVVLFTSGSTGEPKPVLQSHRAMGVHQLGWSRRAFGLGPGDKMLQLSSLSFDVAFWDVFGPLTAGAAVVLLPPGGHRDPHLVVETLRRSEVTQLVTVPSMLAVLLAEPGLARCAALRTVVSGGEVLAPDLVERFRALLPHATLVNGYGPCETSIASTFHRCRPGEAPVPIGAPIEGTEVLLLGEDLAPVAAGEPGEVYLGGAGLAHGYLGDAPHTAARFVAHPFASGARLYRTGDFARRRPDGLLEFCGRSDEQVKLAGQRIELGEIEAALRSVSGVVEASVTARERAGRVVLSAYLVGAVEPVAVRAALRTRLPAHLVPHHFVTLPALPRTATGKLARRELPEALEAVEPAPAQPPALLAVAAEVLGVPAVALHQRFLELGGDSLAAIRLVARARQLGWKVDAQTVLSGGSFEALLASARPLEARPSEVVEEREQWPLAPLQEGLLFRARLGGDAVGAYTVQASWRIEGATVQQVRAAVEQLVARHCALRTELVPDEARGTVQRFGAPLTWREVEAGADRAELLRAERASSLAPLARFAALQLGPGCIELVLTAHHLVLDGGSVEVLERELAHLLEPAAPALPEAVAYSRYLGWLERADVAAAEAAFSRALAGLEHPTRLFGANASPPRQLEGTLDAAATARLEAVAARAKVTVASALSFAWGVVLARLCGKDDVVFGVTVAGRPPELEGADRIVGLLANTVPMRVRLGSEGSVGEAVQRVHRQQLELLPHTALGLAEIQRRAGLGELFDTAVVVERAAAPLQGVGPVRVTRGRCDDATHYPLGLRFTPPAAPGGALEVRLDFDAGRLSPRRAAETLQRVLRVLEALASAWDAPLEALDAAVVPAEERARLAASSEGPPGPAPQSFSALFAAQVARAPVAPALLGEEQTLDYAQLAHRSRCVARWLAARGVRRGDVVAIRARRSVELVVGTLGVLEAGAVCLPIDVQLPEARAQSMRDDAGAVLCLEPPHLAAANGDGAPACAPGADDAAYLIYTSGSTGAPKGVRVGHRGFAALSATQRERLGAGPGTRLLQFFSPAFDVFFSELCFALLSGGALVLAESEDLRSPSGLARAFTRHGVTHAMLPPAMLAELDPSSDLPRDVTLLLGGEALSAELAARWAVGRRVFNSYGPTEATICTTVSAALPDGEVPPIGRPVHGTRAHVLDGRLRPTLAGAPGELYLAGDCVALGYGSAPLTAARFVADPFHSGERMYRTGDVVRRRDDGALEFIGRVDDQVKVRGFRVELKEVEACLMRCDGVALAAATVDDTQGVRRLVGWVVPAAGYDAARLARDVRARLERSLPHFMVPSLVLPLERLPLGPNGKVDRRALPRPSAAASASRPPQSPRELEVCRCFAQTLGVERVGLDDDFFALGGHSLTAVRLAAKLEQALGQPVGVREVFEAPTPARLCARLGPNAAARSALEVLLPLRQGDGAGALFCVHPTSGVGWGYSRLLRHLPPRLSVWALQARGLTGAAPESIDAMADDYAARVVEAAGTGPLALLGYSFGGTVAHAVAARLEARGREVALLALVDSWPIEPERYREELQRPAAPAPLDAALEGQLTAEALQRLHAHHLRLGAEHRHRAVRAEVMLWAATCHPHPLPSWAPWCSAGLTVEHLEATHLQMLDEPTLSLWAPRLARRLTGLEQPT
ncbi:MAG: amino acid adenylation domain-containing protein [Archangiaceae bacterium]|nr:amino acid adenylation domain-containing protein [Archangiaceae bacterium]